LIEGDDAARIHLDLSLALDMAIATILKLQRYAREGRDIRTARLPLIILSTPKGWTGPKTIDGRKVEGSFHSHQVPIENTGPIVAISSYWKSGFGATDRTSCLMNREH
jgi:xylulose-5-phosphate/fructose-6-phosphate phosphoketolase